MKPGVRTDFSSAMGFLPAVIIFLVTYSEGALDYNHRCLLFMNGCVEHCPRMMHPYNTRCDGDTVTQRTCANPEVRVLGFTCGWSRCDCNGNLFLDEENGLCVPWRECTVPYNPKYGLRRGPEVRGPPVNNRVKVPVDGIEDDRVVG